MDFTCVFGALNHGKFPEKDCLLPLISKLLGYCIVAASTTIMKILKHQSIRGLGVISFELEVVGYTIALAYCVHKRLPFSAYGELVFLLVQAIILVAVIYYYSQLIDSASFLSHASIMRTFQLRSSCGETCNCLNTLPLRYCALAPTVLAGQINPALFEALYASLIFLLPVTNVFVHSSKKF
ncbi:Mannose-P-dolichol utilization defect 1 protein-like 2, partial [Cucurbita argyrosperma subsp. argyrosperma]